MFYDSGPKLTNDQILTLDKEDVIKGLIPLALSIVKKYPVKYIERDEATSLALLELVRCVNNIPNLSDKSNVGSYIFTCINLTLRTHCKRWPNNIKHNKKEIRLVRHELDDSTEPSYKQYFAIDLDEVIDSIVERPIERIIITKFLEGGYTQTEIADELGVSRAYISKIKLELFEKLHKVLE